MCGVINMLGPVLNRSSSWKQTLPSVAVLVLKLLEEDKILYSLFAAATLLCLSQLFWLLLTSNAPNLLEETRYMSVRSSSSSSLSQEELEEEEEEEEELEEEEEEVE
jgi:hypothetical protein